MPETDTISDCRRQAPKKPELLAPAGNFEKLEIAIRYGADAVYLAGKDFSLRNFSGNFTDDQLARAVALAHSCNTKVYVACNIYSRNEEQKGITAFLETIGKIHPDAVIVSDPGIILLARKIIPHVDIHLSTQANTTSCSSALFWQSLGIKRVNLARELSLKEIFYITGNTNIETEIFVHGAMCISYSGRCLLSTFLTNRDSNRGLCSHPCRWRYALTEELRPHEFYPVAEDSRGTYLFNSKDLCMIGHIPELIQCKVTSLKIEGRMKGVHYLAAVVKTYRDAIDTYMAAPKNYTMNPQWLDELSRIYHREYSTGFFFNTPETGSPNYKNTHQGQIHSYIGTILESLDDGCHLVDIRNKICLTDQVYVLSPLAPTRKSAVRALYSPEGKPLEQAQPNTRAILKLAHQCFVHDIVCKI
ncbi:MAG: U32 family peptidase [Desulfotignum sp.]|nr:U32 family peptidase [Desulfotignum sp.]MCF8113666.1 U32 family peptidase [Desulfotignum sp.]MCF8126325.1 U32 family peptidase [Desulfotignum sp.]